MEVRNWTKAETKVFCEILVDPINNFMTTLEEKALKKSSTREVFEAIAAEFAEKINQPTFQEVNKKLLSKKKQNIPIACDIKRLQTTYNNLKQKWKKRRDLKKVGSGLAAEEDPEWYDLINPIMTDTNSGLDELSSNPSDTSFYRENFLDTESTENADEDENSNEENNSENNDFATDVIKSNQDDDSETGVSEDSNKKRKVVVKPHEKRGRAKSQLQAITQLASSVSKLAEVSAKKMKSEEKDRESLLNFRREEAEKNRRHEREMSEMFMRFIQSSNTTQPTQIAPSQNVRFANPPFYVPQTNLGTASVNNLNSSHQSIMTNTGGFEISNLLSSQEYLCFPTSTPKKCDHRR